MMWRNVAIDFNNIGRSMAIIEKGLRSIGATAVVDDAYLKNVVLPEMKAAARGLVKALDTLGWRLQ
jgi:sporulation-control protein spo0M